MKRRRLIAVPATSGRPRPTRRGLLPRRVAPSGRPSGDDVLVPSSDWRSRLDDLARERGLPADAAQRLAALLELVRDDPTAPTTIRDPGASVDAHIADSLSALAVPEVRAARRLADLGAGAGFPGLPLAVAAPQIEEVALVESLGRKCVFLERAVAACSARNATVVCERAESWDERALDVVCARAVAPLAVLVEYAAPLLRLGGVLVAWKGRRDAAEEVAGAVAARYVGLEAGDVATVARRPGADHRTLHLYSKARPTPPGFPRRPGMARKRPLSR